MKHFITKIETFRNSMSIAKAIRQDRPVLRQTDGSYIIVINRRNSTY